MNFSEHFDKNRAILLQTVAKWRCIKVCAIFLDHSVILHFMASSGEVEGISKLIISRCFYRTDIQQASFVISDKRQP